LMTLRWEGGERARPPLPVAGCLVESQPKSLFASMPIVWFTAVTAKGYKKRVQSVSAATNRPFYSCPLYRYRKRTDKNLIAVVDLPCRTSHLPDHWVLRGVALVCTVNI
jgi:dynein heavy chain, axonemal